MWAPGRVDHALLKQPARPEAGSGGGAVRGLAGDRVEDVGRSGATRACSSFRSAPTPSNSRSPPPSRSGTTFSCISSIRPAARYCWAASAPPPSLTSLPPAASSRLRQRRLDPVGDEVEGRPALHLQRLALVVGEDEDRHVEGRVLAPPAAPGLVPGAGAAAEHVAPHQHRADVLHRLFDDLAGGVDLAALAAVGLPPGLQLDHPGSPPSPSGSSSLWFGPAT